MSKRQEFSLIKTMIKRKKQVLRKRKKDMWKSGIRKGVRKNAYKKVNKINSKKR